MKIKPSEKAIPHNNRELILEHRQNLGHTWPICQGTDVRCNEKPERPLYRSQIPMMLSRTRLDGTPYGLFLEALEHGDKEGLFECIETLEECLEKFLQILKGRSASNGLPLSTLRHFAENYGLHLPTSWIREYRQRKRHKSRSMVCCQL